MECFNLDSGRFHDDSPIVSLRSSFVGGEVDWVSFGSSGLSLRRWRRKIREGESCSHKARPQLTPASSPSCSPSESKESTLVRRWNHLCHVKHQRLFRIAIPDGILIEVVPRTLVQIFNMVLLCLSRRRPMEDHHLKKRVARRQPCLHHALH